MPAIPSEEALRRLSRGRVGRLATVRPDGTPHVVPVVFALEGRTLYWAVDAKPKRTEALQRLANIRANPAVEVVVDEYHGDWRRLWWVRAAGPARVLAPGADADHALAVLAAKYPPYADRRPRGPVVAVTVRRCVGWAASEPGLTPPP